MLYLSKPGDGVATENIDYPPAWSAIRLAKAIPVAVPSDAYGIDPNYLEQLAKTGQIKAIYLTPLHHFPTTVTTSQQRRAEIYRVSCHYNLHIVEDDYDHEFHYDQHPPPPMAAADPEQRIHYISGFSKLAFPSMRIGFMAVWPKNADDLIKVKNTLSGPNVDFLERAVAEWIKCGDFERHIRRVNRTAVRRRDYTQKILDQLSKQGGGWDYRRVRGGFSIWLNTRKDSRWIVQEARKQGILLQGEAPYQLNPRPASHIRLGFVCQAQEALGIGLHRVADIVQKAPPP